MSILITKHTPGPWKVVKPQYENKKGVFASVYTNPATEKGFRTCEFDIRADEYKNSHAEANARLIAAAPELLDALKTMVEIADASGVVLWGESDEVFAAARAAIQKATGAA